jgi:hypothetical protein
MHVVALCFLLTLRFSPLGTRFAALLTLFLRGRNPNTRLFSRPSSRLALPASSRLFAHAASPSISFLADFALSSRPQPLNSVWTRQRTSSPTRSCFRPPAAAQRLLIPARLLRFVALLC